MVNVCMRFPLDVAQEIFNEHSYCSFKVLKEQDSSKEALQIAPLHATLSEEAEVSDELNFSPLAYQKIKVSLLLLMSLITAHHPQKFKAFLLIMILIMNTHLCPIKQVQHQV